jgi:hypothetical protein
MMKGVVVLLLLAVCDSKRCGGSIIKQDDINLEGCTSLFLPGSGGKLSLASIEKISTAMMEPNKITQMDVGWNNMGTEGISALSKVIENHNSSLSSLTLTWNRLEADGAKILAKALQSSKIRQVELGGNQLGDAGTVAIAEMLKTNEYLTTMEVRRCEIGDIGAKALISAFKVNEKIEIFAIDDNKKITKPVLDELKIEINRRAKLKKEADQKAAELRAIKLAGDQKKYKQEEKKWQAKREAEAKRRRLMRDEDKAPPPPEEKKQQQQQVTKAAAEHESAAGIDREMVQYLQKQVHKPSQKRTISKQYQNLWGCFLLLQSWVSVGIILKQFHIQQVETMKQTLAKAVSSIEHLEEEIVTLRKQQSQAGSKGSAKAVEEPEIEDDYGDDL